VKAVNLIPLEERRGAAGGSSTPTYGVLAVLGLLLVAVAATVVLGNQIGDRKAQLARERVTVAEVQAQGNALKPYATFASMKQKRFQTVSQLASTRFDWEGTMHDLARIVTPKVWITSFLGTVAPGVSVDGGQPGDSATLRTALPNPAVQLSGCATSHDEVARFVSRLRAMNGVTRVSLSGTAKNDTGGGASTGGSAGGGGASAGTDCTDGSDKIAVFSVVAFFKAIPGAPATGTTGAPAPAAAAGAKPGATASAPATPAGSSSPASAGGSK
jgi:Tfp pilus assembly protein PilN